MNEKLAADWQHFFEGRLNKAEELEQQLEKDSFSRWNLRGYLAVERQDYQNAFVNLEAYLIQAQKGSDRENEHIAYHQLAYVARSAGDFCQALEWIEKEAAFLAKYFPDDHYRQSVNLYELGYLNLKLGRLAQAQDFMQKSHIYSMESDDVVNHAVVAEAWVKLLKLWEIYKQQDPTLRLLSDFLTKLVMILVRRK